MEKMRKIYREIFAKRLIHSGSFQYIKFVFLAVFACNIPLLLYERTKLIQFQFILFYHVMFFSRGLEVKKVTYTLLIFKGLYCRWKKNRFEMIE